MLMKIIKVKPRWLQIKMVLAIASTIVFAFITSVSAAPFTLKSLKPAVTANEVTSKLPTITMIFQPDCSWCKKQGIALANVYEQCKDAVNVSLVGAKGNRRQLKQALKHYHKDLPAFIADAKFLRKIGGYQASPTTIIYDDNGDILLKKRGYIANDKLQNVVKVLTQGACLI